MLPRRLAIIRRQNKLVAQIEGDEGVAAGDPKDGINPFLVEVRLFASIPCGPVRVVKFRDLGRKPPHSFRPESEFERQRTQDQIRALCTPASNALAMPLRLTSSMRVIKSAIVRAP